MKPHNPLDLSAVSGPEDALRALRSAAARYYQDAEDLSATWQDAKAGRPWFIIALAIDRAAASAERAIIKAGYPIDRSQL